MSSFLLSIDLGTSSVKVALIDAETLDVFVSADAEYPIEHPSPDYAEQHPEMWWRATVDATRRVLQHLDQPDVIAIGLSGQMHGLVLLDADKRPIQNAIIWADGRSTEQVQELLTLQQNSISSLPGFPATGFAASSLLWLKQNKPEVIQEVDRWCLPKDYLRLRLTDDIVTEPSDAASTWLFDIKAQTWAEDVCNYCGLNPDQMPPVAPSSTVTGLLTSQSAKELGLSPNIPVVGGSADLPAQALGYGINDPRKMLITIGSGGQIFLPVIHPTVEFEEPYYVFNHNVPDTWYVQTSILTAGLSLRWLRDFLGLEKQQDAYSYLSSLAENAPIGANNLLFLPYLAGERNPNPKASAQGLIHGLKLDHTKQHFARAIMEGIGFAIKEAITQIPSTATTYILAGGVVHSPIWCQILADILEQPLQVPVKPAPYGCIGASILAGVGVGRFNSINDAMNQLNQTPKDVFYPQASPAYVDSYQKFRKLYHYTKQLHD